MAEPYVRRAFGPVFGGVPIAAAVSTGGQIGDLLYWDSGNNRWDLADALDGTKIPRAILIGMPLVGVANADASGSVAFGAIIRDDDAPFVRNTLYYLRDRTNGTAVSTTTLQATRPTVAGGYGVPVGRAFSTSEIMVWVNPAGIGDTGKAENGTAANPAFTFEADMDTGMYRVTTNQLGLAVAGALIVVGKANGLNFGTVAPAFGTTQGTNVAIFEGGTAPAGTLATSSAIFASTTVMRKIIADGTVSNIET